MANGENQEKLSPAEVEAYLRGISFPCTKDDLVDKAEGEGADERVLEFLEDLPDKDYHSPIDITKEMKNE